MKFGSVCSGIEAASVAWHTLGWSAAWFAEIEPFPSSVLQHHYPNVANLGDMTQIAKMIRDGKVEAPDVLVGGTPCQAFSIAGLRKSLNDNRGQLSISFVELANAIDTARLIRNQPESIIVWENVPGVLSTADNAFGCFIAALADEDEPIPSPSGGKWANAGCIVGRQRTVAWRVLDAQFFGLAQRRKRVFVIASAREDIHPAKILFESNSMRRNTPPSRKTGQKVAAPITACAFTGGAGGRPEGAIIGHFQPVIAKTPLAKSGSAYSKKLKTYILTFDRQSTGEYGINPVASTVLSRDFKQPSDLITYVLAGNTIGRLPENGGNGIGYDDTGVSYTLTSTDKHAVVYPSNFIGAFKGGQGAKAGGIGFSKETSPTLTATKSGSQLAPVVAFNSTILHCEQITPTLTANGDAHSGFKNETGLIVFNARQTPINNPHIRGTLGSSSSQEQAIVWSDNLKASIDLMGTITRRGDGSQHSGVMQPNMQVRRLTPTECARLQGFPDNYLNIIHNGKPASDSSKYQALGNSMAVSVMHWIGKLIQKSVEK